LSGLNDALNDTISESTQTGQSPPLEWFDSIFPVQSPSLQYSTPPSLIRRSSSTKKSKEICRQVDEGKTCEEEEEQIVNQWMASLKTELAKPPQKISESPVCENVI
jgi:hypothetical protein